MQNLIRTIAFALSLICLLCLHVASAPAQQGAPERAANLHEQLADVQAKQVELQMRLQQIEAALDPFNIERSLAGVGSTHPEELREQRRRQLENQRTGVINQLDQLAVSRMRLEQAVAQADADAYHQSARPYLSPDGYDAAAAAPTRGRPTNQTRARRFRKHRPREF